MIEKPKPLFVPLRTRYFRAFEDGTKTTEYRRYGRAWNEHTVVPGRAVVLSHGYSGARLSATVVRLRVICARELADPDPYGPNDVLAAIDLEDIEPLAR